ncbi:retrotransposon protein, putative, unclassified [Senna tora]|uniref:Retrotransposon protein, putative, unclassified n=1 Tax=Senna tora TaxID=362788 RepID=A0A834TFG1_9FABA|nr:retrotransposon protein, putative, unclassified [Senna tora]
MIHLWQADAARYRRKGGSQTRTEEVVTAYHILASVRSDGSTRGHNLDKWGLRHVNPEIVIKSSTENMGLWHLVCDLNSLPESQTDAKQRMWGSGHAGRDPVQFPAINTKCPQPSTKVFLMRAAREILSTCEALTNQGLDVDRNCMTCKVEEENCLHTLIRCSSLSEFWRGTKQAFVNACKEGIDFLEWLYMALTQWNDKEAKMFAIATQRVWFCRNKARKNHV